LLDPPTIAPQATANWIAMNGLHRAEVVSLRA